MDSTSDFICSCKDRVQWVFIIFTSKLYHNSIMHKNWNIRTLQHWTICLFGNQRLKAVWITSFIWFWYHIYQLLCSRKQTSLDFCFQNSAPSNISKILNEFHVLTWIQHYTCVQKGIHGSRRNFLRRIRPVSKKEFDKQQSSYFVPTVTKIINLLISLSFGTFSSAFESSIVILLLKKLFQHKVYS